MLFSGQDQLAAADRGCRGLVRRAPWCCSFVCKGLAYALSLSSFRGGPVFPGMFIGAAGGIALSHLPGPADDRGGRDGHRRDDRRDARPAARLGPARRRCSCRPTAVALMPLVIVAVVVSYVISARLATP